MGLFHLRTELRDSVLHRETHGLQSCHPPRRWLLEHEGEKSRLVEHPQGKGDVTSPTPREWSHPDPANVWTQAAFKDCISMCLL